MTRVGVILGGSCVFSGSPLAADHQGFQNWLQLRDKGVVRQQRDFSCGLAALATILRFQFGLAVSEQSLLDELLPEIKHDVANAGVSFAALAGLANRRLIGAVGVSVSYETLLKLRQPAIVALTVNGRDHFSVLKRIDDDGNVWLADPSWGNRRLAQWQFAPMFLSFADNDSRTTSRGRLLLFRFTSNHDDANHLTLEDSKTLNHPGNEWRMTIPPSFVRSST